MKEDRDRDRADAWVDVPGKVKSKEIAKAFRMPEYFTKGVDALAEKIEYLKRENKRDEDDIKYKNIHEADVKFLKNEIRKRSEQIQELEKQIEKQKEFENLCNSFRYIGSGRREDGMGPAKDQQAKADSGKLRLTLVPREIIRNIAAVREYGTRKYKDPENWRRVEEERFRNAAFRHFLAFLDEPEGADEESGLPHLWHLACNIAFLCEKEKERGTWTGKNF